MADERYRAAMEAATEEVASLEAQVVEKKKLANMLAQLAGFDAPFSDVVLPITAQSALIRADQFANFSYPSEAARSFLTWRGQEKGAVDLDVIYEGLSQGGFSFGSTKNDAKGGLRIALGKDALVRKLPNGSYGLWEWYPGAKRDKEKVRPKTKPTSEPSAPEGEREGEGELLPFDEEGPP